MSSPESACSSGTQGHGSVQLDAETEKYIALFKELSAQVDVQGVVQDYAGVTKCASGVVARNGERLTEVARHSAFCRFVRKSPLGDEACAWADQIYADQAFQNRRPIRYYCHANLVDFVAPITLGGRHVANVYGGELRPAHLCVDAALSTYEELKLDAVDVPRDEFEAAFRDLQPESGVDVEASIALLARIAALISERADWALMTDTMARVSDRIGPALDRAESLNAYLREAKRAIHFDSASVVLWDQCLQQLVFGALDWGETATRRFKHLRFARGEGLIGTVFKRNEPILCRDRRELDQIAPKDGASRDMRGLESFIGVPVRLDRGPVGVLEVGARTSGRFDWPQVDLLKAVASHISVSLQVNELRSHLVRLVSEEDLTSILTETAKLVHGKGCSLFLRGPEGDAVLAASLGLDQSLIGTASYQPGEGLTGWVYKTGRSLPLPAGDRRDLTHIADDLVWKSKWREFPDDKRDMDKRPFLAVPVRRSGDVVGVLRVSDRDDDANFSEEDQHLLSAVASHIGTVLDADRLSAVAPFLDPAVFRALTTAPPPPPVRRPCTIWFTDIRGFSRLSDAVRDTADWTAPFLNLTSDFYALVVEGVSKHTGVITDLRGDGAMALFGVLDPAPDDKGAWHAVRAAMAVKREFAKLMKQHGPSLKRLTSRVVEIDVAFGIMTGEAVVGAVEVPGRTHFTALGGNVNIAQRICAAAPPGAVWIAAPTHQALLDHPSKKDSVSFESVPTPEPFKNIPYEFSLFAVTERR